MNPSSARARFSLIESGASRDFASFAEEVLAGLSAEAKRIPCRFLYDEAGSLLFERICDLPEYYLTRAEREILETRAGEVAARFPAPITLAELGSGSAAKSQLLIEAFLRRHGRLRYVPVDISRSILETSSLDLLTRYEGLEIRAIASEYSEGLRHVRAETGRPKLIAWLGSTVGNLERWEAAAFLKSVRQGMTERDRMLIGIDLRKERVQLEAAYDDAQGVTALFTLNLLERINRELGGRFDVGHFRHHSSYLEGAGRIEIHLVSTRAQRVPIGDLGLEVEFERDEPIHIENSYKYSSEEIEALAAAAGLRVEHDWLDGEKRFSLSLFAPL